MTGAGVGFAWLHLVRLTVCSQILLDTRVCTACHDMHAPKIPCKMCTSEGKGRWMPGARGAAAFAQAQQSCLHCDHQSADSAMAYLQGLPEPLASKADAELLLGDARLPVHTQIVSLHSTGVWQGRLIAVCSSRQHEAAAAAAAAPRRQLQHALRTTPAIHTAASTTVQFVFAMRATHGMQCWQSVSQAHPTSREQKAPCRRSAWLCPTAVQTRAGPHALTTPAAALCSRPPT